MLFVPLIEEVKTVCWNEPLEDHCVCGLVSSQMRVQPQNAALKLGKRVERVIHQCTRQS